MSKRCVTVFVGLFLAVGCGGDYASGSGGDFDPGGGSGSSGSSGSGGEAGLLTAAEWDDNLNFDHFTESLDELFANEREHASLPLSQRIVVSVTDSIEAPVSNALVEVMIEGDVIASLPTATDGRALLFPALDEFDAAEATIRVSTTDGASATATPHDGVANITVDTDASPASALDLAFVIDATGSMGDELRYLQAETANIATSIASDYPAVSLRYALVVYRDVGDDYTTRTVAFTSDLSAFIESLDAQSAGGGGDYPEAAEAALGEALGLEWRSGNVARVAFHVADAPPHAENSQTMLDLGNLARLRGIKLYPIAASGVGNEAEYLMRVNALLTMARYLFLTDDSGIGNTHAEPHIPCYQVQHLDELLLRTLQSELSGTHVPAEPDDIVRTVGVYEAGRCVVTSLAMMGESLEANSVAQP